MLRFTLPGLIAATLFTHAVKAQARDAPTGKAEADKETPGLLLANVWTPSIDPTGWWMSEKYDGLRGYWDGKKLWSRKGNAIHAPDYFLAELPADIALDGELWIGRGKFEETISTVLSQTPDGRWRQVRFMVFDAPQAKGAFEQRTQFVKATLPAKNEFVKPVPQERCKGAAQLIAERDRIVKLSGEGLMLRKPESEYEAGRSPTLLKVKPQDDAEATVIAHLPGKGKFVDKLGSLRVRTADGREFSIGTGFTDTQRESPPPVGAIVTYRFRGLTSKGTPRFPSFLRVRKD
jgi:DNA ligase-1